MRKLPEFSVTQRQNLAQAPLAPATRHTGDYFNGEADEKIAYSQSSKKWGSTNIPPKNIGVAMQRKKCPKTTMTASFASNSNLP